MMAREEIVDRLWQKCEPLLFIPKEVFVRSLVGWEVAAVEIDGVPSFITAVKGAHFHFDTLDTGRQITRKMIRDFLRPILTEHGYAMTKTPIEDTRQQRFNIAMGFEEVLRDGYDVHFRLSRIRGEKCQ